MNNRIIFVICLLLFLPVSLTSANPRVKIKDGGFYVDGNPFFVKGIGYECGARPNRLPWKRKFEPDLRAYDIKLIKEAGFNTLRSWAPYMDEELDMFREAGLMVIQGIWVDHKPFFTDPVERKKILRDVRKEVKRSMKYDNILYYMVMNEPPAELLIEIGGDTVTRLFSELVRAVKDADSSALVSFSNCPLTDFIDMSPFDIVSFNNYPYYPSTLHSGLGYYGYNKWAKEKYSENKPYMVTEFGLSVSPEGPGKYGYGGNTLKEQSDGIINMYRDIIDAGAAGVSVFMWSDGWWKSPLVKENNENQHDPHPEEWFGILDITDPVSDTFGTPRPVYHALKDFQRAIRIEPRPGTGYSFSSIPLRFYVTQDITSINVITPDGKNTGLDKTSENWFEKTLDMSTYKGDSLPLVFKVYVKEGVLIREETIAVMRTSEKEILTISSDKNTISWTDTSLPLHIRISPPKDEKIRVSIFQYYGRVISEDWLTLNEKGIGVYNLEPGSTNGWLSITASPFDMTNPFRRRPADMKLIYVQPLDDETILNKLDSEDRLWTEVDSLKYESIYKLSEDFKERYQGKGKFTLFPGSMKTDRGWHPGIKVHFTVEDKGAWMFTQKKFDPPVDFTKFEYWTIGVHDLDTPGATLKVMLGDPDGERWYNRIIKLNGMDDREIVFATASLERDPYDNVKDGNNTPDMKNISSIAIVLTADSGEHYLTLSGLNGISHKK